MYLAWRQFTYLRSFTKIVNKVVDINSIFNQNMITCYNLDQIITFLWEKGIIFGNGELVFAMIASLRENLKNEVRLFNVL